MRSKQSVSVRTAQRKSKSNAKDETTDDELNSTDEARIKTENRVSKSAAKPKGPVIALRSPAKKSNGTEEEADEAETPSPEYSDIEPEESGARDQKPVPQKAEVRRSSRTT